MRDLFLRALTIQLDSLKSAGGTMPKLAAFGTEWARQESGFHAGSEGDGVKRRVEAGLLRISAGDLSRLCADNAVNAFLSAAACCSYYALGLGRAKGNLLHAALWARTAHAMGSTDADSTLPDEFKFSNAGNLDAATYERRTHSCIIAANAFAVDNGLNSHFNPVGAGTYRVVQTPPIDLNLYGGHPINKRKGK